MSLVIDDSVGFDEPGSEAPEVSAAKDRNVLAISQDMDRVKNALNEFDRVSAGLVELEANYPKDVVYEVQTTKGMKDAIEHRAAWRDPRILVEKARKMAKAPLLALGKNIDARAAWLTEKLLEGEQPIDQLIKAEEARREEEKQARINAEAGRILAIQEALAEIGQEVLIACGQTSAEVRALSERMHATLPDPDVFQEMLPQAKEAWVNGIAKLETTLKAKLWDEAEQARIQQEQEAEAERRRQEAIKLEAQRIENARISAEQKAEADKLAAERAEFERERAALQAEKDRIAAEAKEREEAAARAEQMARIEREREEEEKAQREQIAQQNSEAQTPQQVLKAEPETADATDRGVSVITSPSVGSMGAGQAADAAPAGGTEVHIAGNGVRFIRPAAPAVQEQPTLTLGAMKDRLGFALPEAFLAELGFESTPVKGARLYRESQFGDICAALVRHIESVRAEVALGVAA